MKNANYALSRRKLIPPDTIQGFHVAPGKNSLPTPGLGELCKFWGAEFKNRWYIGNGRGLSLIFMIQDLVLMKANDVPF